MPNNGTVALWCTPVQGAGSNEIEAHFNYWRVSGKRSVSWINKIRDIDFFEFGVMVTDIEKIDSISFYFPICIGRDQIEDCSDNLSKMEFAQGIFNEVLSVTTQSSDGLNCIILQDRNHATFCRVHKFGSSPRNITASELELASEEDGTVLTITPNAIGRARSDSASVPGRAYFRLRIYLKQNDDRNPFIKVIRPHDRLFTSSIDEIEYIDFRLNEARTLPRLIKERMRNDRSRGGEITVRLVAFLTAVLVHSELSFSHPTSYKMRLLEESWNGYVGTGIPKGMVVYHWKRFDDPDNPSPITDFTAFVKLRTRRTSWVILLTYLGIAFGIGIIGNLAASWAWAHFPSWSTETPRCSSPDSLCTTESSGKELTMPPHASPTVPTVSGPDSGSGSKP